MSQTLCLKNEHNSEHNNEINEIIIRFADSLLTWYEDFRFIIRIHEMFLRRMTSLNLLGLTPESMPYINDKIIYKHNSKNNIKFILGDNSNISWSSCNLTRTESTDLIPTHQNIEPGHQRIFQSLSDRFGEEDETVLYHIEATILYKRHV